MSPNQGGIETFMINIFSHLEGHGFHFDFLNNYKRNIAYSNKIKRDGGVIRNVKISTNIFGHLVRAHQVKKFLRKHHNYDIVHVNAMSVNAVFWLRMANKFDIHKLIIQSHVDNRVYPSLFKKMCASLLALRNYYYLKHHSNIIELAVNKKSGKWMFKNNKFHIINNGIDVNKFKFHTKNRIKLREKLNIGLNDKVIITVARLSYQKNYFKIIRIFNHIHNVLRNHVKLVIVGNGKEKNKIKKLIQNLNLCNDVIFLGSINYVYKILSIADLMLMPSRYEGFPFCLIEGQSVGVPALVSGAIPKSSNITGYLKYMSIEDNDLSWAKEAIKILDINYNVKRKLNMNYLVSQSDFNIDKTIKDIKTIYSRNNYN